MFQGNSLPGDSKNLLDQFLQQNQIYYQHVPAFHPHEVSSPGGKFIAKDDGIYFVESGQRIAKSPPSFVIGWTSDGNGAIYSSGGLCLIQRGLPFADDAGCAVRVPQPVLLLKVPKEYLPSTETP